MLNMFSKDVTIFLCFTIFQNPLRLCLEMVVVVPDLLPQICEFVAETCAEMVWYFASVPYLDKTVG